MAGHGADISDDRFHIFGIHSSERHATLLHLFTVMPQQVFKHGSTEDGSRSSQTGGCYCSMQSANAMAGLTGIALKYYFSLQRFWTKRQRVELFRSRTRHFRDWDALPGTAVDCLPTEFVV